MSLTCQPSVCLLSSFSIPTLSFSSSLFAATRKPFVCHSRVYFSPARALASPRLQLLAFEEEAPAWSVRRGAECGLAPRELGGQEQAGSGGWRTAPRRRGLEQRTEGRSLLLGVTSATIASRMSILIICILITGLGIISIISHLSKRRRRQRSRRSE